MSAWSTQKNRHPGEGDNVAGDEVEHADFDGGGALKRKRDSDSKRSTMPQSPAPRSKARKLVWDSRLLALLQIDLMSRPKGRSLRWPEYNSHNCNGDEIPKRVLHCSQRTSTTIECNLSLIRVPESQSNNAMERGVKLFDITLSTRCAPGYNRFAIKILETLHIPGYLESMESHAFMLAPHPVISWKNRRDGRKQFEALINSHADSALISSLKGGIFPLSAASRGASPASRAHRRQESSSPASRSR
jgi:hypothetical protein